MVWNRGSRRAISLICFSLIALAQQNESPGQASAAPSDASQRITLDAVVSDKSGKAVPGLQRQDFTLLDNKQPQQILSFEAVQGGGAAAEPPIEVILLVDEVNTAFANVSYERQQIEKFVREDEERSRFRSHCSSLAIRER